MLVLLPLVWWWYWLRNLSTVTPLSNRIVSYRWYHQIFLLYSAHFIWYCFPLLVCWVEFWQCESAIFAYVLLLIVYRPFSKNHSFLGRTIRSYITRADLRFLYILQHFFRIFIFLDNVNTSIYLKRWYVSPQRVSSWILGRVKRLSFELWEMRLIFQIGNHG